MSNEPETGISMIEIQEEFIQHMERGGRKIRVLAAIATLAGGYFAATYFFQLVILPYALGITTQTVDLVDPGLVAAGLVSLVISLAWCLAGVRDLAFERKMAKRIKEVRALQSEGAKRYGLAAGPTSS